MPSTFGKDANRPLSRNPYILAKRLQSLGTIRRETVRRGLPVETGDASMQIDRGIALQLQGNLTEAIACYERAMELLPGSTAALNNRGLALHALGRLDEAAASLAEAIARHPEQAEAHTGLGNVRQAQGRLDAAAACHERALAARPDYAEAWSNLGIVRHLQGRLDEAAEWCARATLLKPDFAEGHNNLGDALTSLSRLDDARRCFEKAIELKPAYAQAHFNLAANLLLRGNFVDGWPEYEWRLRLTSQREFVQPRWRGEPLACSGTGARILLHTEQGMGDTLQFLRYLPMVRAAGGVVVLEVQPQLRRLVAWLPGMEKENLLAAGEPLPEFAWHCPLMSLPLAFGAGISQHSGADAFSFCSAGGGRESGEFYLAGNGVSGWTGVGRKSGARKGRVSIDPCGVAETAAGGGWGKVLFATGGWCGYRR